MTSTRATHPSSRDLTWSRASAAMAAARAGPALSTASSTVFASATSGRPSPRRPEVEPPEVNLRARGVQVGRTLRELGDLADAAADRQPGNRMFRQVLEHAARKVAHVEHGVVRHRVMRLHDLFGCLARASGHMLEPVGARDIDAAVNRRDPGRAGIRANDSGRAENRDPADDAEAGIPGLLGKFPPARHRDRHADVGTSAKSDGFAPDGLGNHFPGNRIDRRFARRQRQTGPGNRSDAVPRNKRYSA